MKQIDVRFTASNIEDIQSMIGKKMLRYKCDPFEFFTSVYGIVGISFEDVSYAFTNHTEAIDYYGDWEDVAIFRIHFFKRLFILGAHFFKRLSCQLTKIMRTKTQRVVI